jgi:hypothetical protein
LTFKSPAASVFKSAQFGLAAPAGDMAQALQDWHNADLFLGQLPGYLPRLPDRGRGYPRGDLTYGRHGVTGSASHH